MEAVVGEVVAPEDLEKFGEKYKAELAKGCVSKDTQFEYAWCLIRSKHSEDIKKGIVMLDELIHKGTKDGQRDYLFYLAVANYKLKEYERGLKYIRILLKNEPGNSQALDLEKLIDKAMKKGYIQACRALMITSVVMGTFGLVATLVGMQCSKIGGENYVMKDRVTGIGGVFFILQGLCTMIAVSWYAFRITQEFFDPLYLGIKYEIGEGLYIGWSSATLALCGGSCLLCSCRLHGPEEKKSDLQNFRTYSYQPQSKSAVQTASATSHATSSQYGRNAYV
ncbi:mitochondrial fission 1 protein-like isoform X2 [Myxocyprinus asiaticus]|uniref:mitochondrial fission 1 protein-like isoform X2 n=1 Tax=Myxocyprinus asiaticus TaxID=70543 RepID=UPI002223893F|nr:mitochondrial fission 1 protein-like isoform X2 [Myxocyprinus asiaticus]